MLCVEFRKYQEDMLSAFDAIRSRGERKFHFVAPPGSGKTLIGLELMHRLGAKAAVFSPTVAIQAQWVDVCRTYSNSASASADPYSDADLVSLTYQSASVKAEDGVSFHRNVEALLAVLSDRKTIILDECHHLTDEWARALSLLDTPDRCLIGLTATPPIDRDEKSRETYAELLGPVSYEIPVPPVVKEGYLAPFQDLVYVCAPTDDEAALIDSLCAPYRALMRDLLATNELTPIHFWTSDRLTEYRDERGRVLPFDELLAVKPGYCVAAVRFVSAKKGEVPPSVFFVSEMEERLSFPDILEVLADYALRYLKPLSVGSEAGSRTAKRFLSELEAALKDVGYALTESGFRAQGIGVRGLLGKSRSKIHALKPILLREMETAGDDFSCLILTDYEDGGGRDGTCALDVMRFLTENPEIDECDPILVTGRTVLVDDDLWDEFSVCAETFFAREGYAVVLKRERVEGFYEVNSDSPDWTTRAYVPLITHLLERGITRCVVSTRSMLGEGWNAVRLNTLIDLTVASGYAFVNQMRGRTLRLDPARPLKTANNWDIVAILNDSEQGDYDLERLRRKYSRFFGMGNDGSIEKGIVHLHPALADRAADRLFADRAALNQAMLDRARDRSHVRTAWRVGSPYRDEVLHCADVFLAEGKEYGGPSLPRRAAEEAYKPFRLLVSPVRKTLLPLTLAGAAAFNLGLAAVPGGGSSAGFLIPLFTLSILFSFPRSSGLIGIAFSPFISFALMGKDGSRRLLARLCRLVLEAASDPSSSASRSVVIERREDGFRVFSRDPSLSPILASSLAEMSAPPSRGRYVIRTAALLTHKSAVKRWLDFSKLPRLLGRGRKKKEWELLLRQTDKSALASDAATLLVPVPEAFSKKREDAERFLALWNRDIGPAELIGNRSRDYARTVLPRAKEKPLPFGCAIREIWV